MENLLFLGVPTLKHIRVLFTVPLQIGSSEMIYIRGNGISYVWNGFDMQSSSACERNIYWAVNKHA